jgi:hypothetical protein
MLISKKNFKIFLKNIISMYFQMKRTLKSNRYYNTKKTLKAILIIFLKKKILREVSTPLF